MLTNEDIERRASEHVSGRYGAQLVAVALFQLEEPQGVFFKVSAPARVPATRAELADGAFGDAGFFVYRRDGMIRQFDPGDFVAAASHAPRDAEDRRLVRAVTSALQRLGKDRP